MIGKVNFNYFFQLEGQDTIPPVVSGDCKSTFKSNELGYKFSFIKSTASHRLTEYFVSYLFLTFVPMSQKVPGSECLHYFLGRALPKTTFVSITCSDFVDVCLKSPTSYSKTR